jgi:acetoin utilization deacetylase AcuC-like enzyme
VSYAGHHARRSHAAGFCFVNGAAIAAHYALSLGLERVAVVDIDTHAGDGTVLSVLNEPRVFFGETYQPGFPGAFLERPTRDGIFRLKTESAGKFKEYWERILEKLTAFQPQLLLISAGFDAHVQDPLTRIGVQDSTYSWLGERFAQLPCPIVCGLEGGYNLDSTRRAATLFCEQLATRSAV